MTKLNELLYMLECGADGIALNRPFRLAVASKLRSLNECCQDLHNENLRLKAELENLRSAQTTHYCVNCESSMRQVEALQKKLEDAISNIPKVCPTCMYRDATGDIMNVKRCEGCYFNGVPAWEWNEKANTYSGG